MPRYRLEIEYNGTPYHGWQRQDGLPSVQQALEEAIFRFCGERATLFAAGRTDAGVHALGQVAHVDLSADWRPFTVAEALNAHLVQNGQPVALVNCALVPKDFDARFSATARSYRYLIVNRRAPLTVERERAWQVKKPLDVEAMHEAAQHLVGHHDFTTFRAVNCQAKSPHKTLDRLAVVGTGERIEIRANSRSFLHHQVRSMAGSLKLVGEGRWSDQDLKAALEACDRKACGPVAPAYGLYLEKVAY